MAADPLAPGDQDRCAECGKLLPKANMLQFGNIWICAGCKPAYLQKLQEGVSVTGGAIWRSGKKLIMRKGAQLPDRCIKCNAPAEGPGLVRKLSWHPPLVYLLIFLNLIIYVLVAVIISKRATVTIGLCAKHRAVRRRNIWVAWGIFAVSVTSFIGAAVYSVIWLLISGIMALLGLLFFAYFLGRIAYAQRIDQDYIWLGGVCPEFLAELPEWTGRG